MARVHNAVRVAYLSPLMEALLVKPANNLSFQPCVNHTLDDASANFLNCQLGPPM
jgi:hypothetical protein